MCSVVAGIPTPTPFPGPPAATAVEALFGYLYLQGKTERLNALFTLMMGE